VTERSVRGAENGVERVKNQWSGRGAVSGRVKICRSVSGAWSGRPCERAKLAARIRLLIRNFVSFQYLVAVKILTQS